MHSTRLPVLHQGVGKPRMHSDCLRSFVAIFLIQSCQSEFLDLWPFVACLSLGERYWHYHVKAPRHGRMQTVDRSRPSAPRSEIFYRGDLLRTGVHKAPYLVSSLFP